MDVRSQYLFLILGLLLIGSVIVTFHRAVVLRDYPITIEVSCNPEEENCFVRTEDDDSETFYKILVRNAGYIRTCDPEQDLSCGALTCPLGEPGCELSLCTAETVPEGERCSQY